MDDRKSLRLDEASLPAASLAPAVHPIAGSEAMTTVKDTAADTLQLLEEALKVSKRQVSGETVRVSTRTETHEEIAEVSLERATVEVIRVPMDRLVDEAPAVRNEGDTMIVPVVEERLVVVKQLYLVEELHIRQRVEHELVRTPIALRRQHAVIERVDPTTGVSTKPTP